MSCKKYQDYMVEAHYGELDEDLIRELDAHVASCGDCLARSGEIELTLNAMTQRRCVDPGDEFWDGYWERLEARLNKDEVALDRTHAAWWMRRVGGGGSVRSWTYRAATVAVLIAIGVFGDRVFLSPPTNSVYTDPVEQLPMNASQVRAQVASARAMRYVDKSQMLLLSLVNTDPAQDGYASGAETQRERSQALLAEAPMLQKALNGPQQRRLRELVGDLEKILREIANLEEQDDIEAVELIRGSVNRHDLMLKINLEQMRNGSGEAPVLRDDV